MTVQVGVAVVWGAGWACLIQPPQQRVSQDDGSVSVAVSFSERPGNICEERGDLLHNSYALRNGVCVRDIERGVRESEREIEIYEERDRMRQSDIVG